MKKQNLFLLCMFFSTFFSTFFLIDIKAIDYTWVSSDLGDWNDASKWLPNGIPGPTDNVEISGPAGPELVSHTVIHNLTVLTEGNIRGNFDLTVNGLLTFNGSLSPGLCTGNGTLTVNGDFVWLKGMIGAPYSTDSVIVNGLMILSGAGEHHSVRKKTLVCVGGVNWQGGQINCSNGAHWIIPSGATLTETCTTNADIHDPFGGGGIFENKGHFIRSGTAPLGINLPFINSGTFTSNGGPIFFQYNCLFQNEPTGIIDGTGSINVQLEDFFINLGSIKPGLQIGELNLTNSPNGVIQNNTLEIDISGSGGPGTGHDRLNITGDFDIAGSTLQLELLGGYSPSAGTSFQIALATDSVKGTFSTLNVPPDFIVTYTTNSITVLKNAPPVCAITNPSINGFLYYDPNTILVEALATDVNDTVALVEFFLDGIKFGEDNTAPYSNSNLVNTPVGMYTLTVKATDSFGASTFSAPVEITVRCILEDIDNNATVNTPDYLLFLSSFGITCSGCPADFNLDGAVSTFDFLSLLAVFGYSCN